jgi:hypothetical protein
MQQFKIVVEKHEDGYIAYPLGVKGVVIGEGDTFEDALAVMPKSPVDAPKARVIKTFEQLLKAYEQI